MDVCIINGADREGGISLCRHLVERGFRVYGLVAQQQEWGLDHPDFVSLEIGQLDRAQAEAVVRAIGEYEGGVAGIIHLARAFSTQTFQDVSPDELEELVYQNLTLPLLINRWLLPELKVERGHVIQCCMSIGKGPRVGGTLYLSLEEGLQRFYRRWYEELRGTGIRVTCLRPFGVVGETTEQEHNHRITGEFLADAILQVLTQVGGGFFTDLEIRPEPMAAGTRKDPSPNHALQLSSMRIPPALEKDNQKKSFTLPKRKSPVSLKKQDWADRPIDFGPAPEVNDDEEEEEFVEPEAPRAAKQPREAAHPRQKPQPKPREKEEPAPAPSGETTPAATSGETPPAGEGNRSRRRRRGRGRGRDRDRTGSTQEEGRPAPATTGETPREPQPEKKISDAPRESGRRDDNRRDETRSAPAPVATSPAPDSRPAEPRREDSGSRPADANASDRPAGSRSRGRNRRRRSVPGGSPLPRPESSGSTSFSGSSASSGSSDSSGSSSGPAFRAVRSSGRSPQDSVPMSAASESKSSSDRPSEGKSTPPAKPVDPAPEAKPANPTLAQPKPGLSSAEPKALEPANAPAVKKSVAQKSFSKRVAPKKTAAAKKTAVAKKAVAKKTAAKKTVAKKTATKKTATPKKRVTKPKAEPGEAKE